MNNDNRKKEKRVKFSTMKDLIISSDELLENKYDNLPEPQPLQTNQEKGTL